MKLVGALRKLVLWSEADSRALQLVEHGICGLSDVSQPQTRDLVANSCQPAPQVGYHLIAGLHSEQELQRC